MTYILSIDPGVSSGFALGVVKPGKPYELVKAWQVEGGVTGLIGWVEHELPDLLPETIMIAEKFTPLQNKGFSHTLGSVEPLRGEGALIALGLMPDYPDKRWRRPQDMYIFGGTNLKERKKKAQKFLKDNGMYITGKMVGCKDADDSRSAIWHGLSYTAQELKSKETFQLIADWSEREEG